MALSVTPEFIRAIPKTDLHVHLDGSLRLSTLVELARAQRVELPSYTEQGLRELVFRDRYANLGEYLHGFQYTCAVLSHPEALERTSYELAADAFREGVRYLEVRFAPQLHINARMDIAECLGAVSRGLARAEREYSSTEAVREGREPAFRAGIIVCAMRMFSEKFSDYYRRYVGMHRFRSMRRIIQLASVDLAEAAVRVRDNYGFPVVGFDLAGQEDGYPASAHREAYDIAHKNFLKKTVHAGEAFGPESIFQAITELNADRIGHGYHLFDPEKISDEDIRDPEGYVQALANYIAHRRITIEVCLTSNMQTLPSIGSIEKHNFRRMLESRLSTTLCTDNRLVSNTTMCKEFQLAVDHFPLTRQTLKNLVIYGFKRSFFPGTYAEKRVWVRQVSEYYERLEAEHGVSDGAA